MCALISYLISASVGVQYTTACRPFLPNPDAAAIRKMAKPAAPIPPEKNDGGIVDVVALVLLHTVGGTTGAAQVG